MTSTSPRPHLQQPPTRAHRGTCAQPSTVRMRARLCHVHARRDVQLQCGKRPHAGLLRDVATGVTVDLHEQRLGELVAEHVKMRREHLARLAPRREVVHHHESPICFANTLRPVPGTINVNDARWGRLSVVEVRLRVAQQHTGHSEGKSHPRGVGCARSPVLQRARGPQAWIHPCQAMLRV